MGILRIPNEMSLTNPLLVRQCLDWLADNHNAEIKRKWGERKQMVYQITGDDIPDGNFHLVINDVVPGVISIKIEQ